MVGGATCVACCRSAEEVEGLGGPGDDEEEESTAGAELC